MTSEFNLLFTSAGRRVSLIGLFKQALSDLGQCGKIVTADLKSNAPAHFVADVSELVPSVMDGNYIDRLMTICRKHQIRLVVPLIDTELPLLAPHRKLFQDMGITLLISSPEVIEVGRDKRVTARFFQRAGVQTPELLDPEVLLRTADGEPSPFPVLLKPADGSAGAGVTIIKNGKELDFFKDYVPNAIVQEFIRGNEYTLDILIDFAGRVRCVVPRLRMETRAGEVSKGMTVKHPAIIEAGARVGAALPAGAVGCITVQCILQEEGGISFIEVNPRFGGGFPLAAEAGANYPRWIVEWMLDRDPEIALDGWRDGIVMLRYDAEVFTTREAIA